MRYFSLIALILITFAAKAQTIEMADTMRSEGKIYVVIAVLGIILFGLIAYLISIDRKLSKVEKQVNS
jgi:K+-transporting ATPase A subunit